MDLRFHVYFTCDSASRCLEFASLNHKPAHTSNAMQLRNFNVGQYWCDTHKENHDMPTRGLDVYVGTYPCSPWSRRGKRTGFAHPDAEVALIGLKSIAHMRPGVWIIEIGEMPSVAGLAELTQQNLGDDQHERAGVHISDHQAPDTSNLRLPHSQDTDLYHRMAGWRLQH